MCVLLFLSVVYINRTLEYIICLIRIWAFLIFYCFPNLSKLQKEVCPHSAKLIKMITIVKESLLRECLFTEKLWMWIFKKLFNNIDIPFLSQIPSIKTTFRKCILLFFMISWKVAHNIYHQAFFSKYALQPNVQTFGTRGLWLIICESPPWFKTDMQEKWHQWYIYVEVSGQNGYKVWSVACWFILYFYMSSNRNSHL